MGVVDRVVVRVADVEVLPLVAAVVPRDAPRQVEVVVAGVDDALPHRGARLVRGLEQPPILSISPMKILSGGQHPPSRVARVPATQRGDLFRGGAGSERVRDL